MIAGRMGIGFLKEAVTGQVPEALKRLSINELAELVCDDCGYAAGPPLSQIGDLKVRSSIPALSPILSTIYTVAKGISRQQISNKKAALISRRAPLTTR
jgi:hypothetical protein